MKSAQEQLKALEVEQKRLEEEKKKLRREAEKLNEQYEKVSQRLERIQAERHRLRLLDLVGVPDGVQRRFRTPPGSKTARLNDQKGTLLKVRKTRGVVDWSGEEWDHPLDQLLPADQQQGFAVP
jgi:hypothetical protein